MRDLLCSGVSQRRAARLLNLTRRTVVRKLLFLAEQAQQELQRRQENSAPVLEMEFDDMETFEHTKCKPLSITLAVEAKSRRILGFEVSRMPANGLLAALSRKKYGPRADERPQARQRLFSRIREYIGESALIRSDSNPHYPADVKKHFPNREHQTVKGKRGAITGQGELKKTGHDPLFSLNHTCAKFRADVNRLIRRTWCTTKRPDRLTAHLTVYALYHNLHLKPAR